MARLFRRLHEVPLPTGRDEASPSVGWPTADFGDPVEFVEYLFRRIAGTELPRDQVEAGGEKGR